jgi:hypothetical protein
MPQLVDHRRFRAFPGFSGLFRRPRTGISGLSARQDTGISGLSGFFLCRPRFRAGLSGEI